MAVSTAASTVAAAGLAMAAGVICGGRGRRLEQQEEEWTPAPLEVQVEATAKQPQGEQLRPQT
eukprot:CAMPEP_0183472284 /NCGR_PEP_ID=MMETSP0370-20130417/159319_1 /TAXON_ID=268820 /ORGANISM="Peridinium aciculiferum, Strain PAER-2" /LENGTH=62 /DNA_ID=CAMNT_0025664913 /DNA_START=35 /DNA_END=219 /DNA_ORIENTATION=+